MSANVANDATRRPMKSQGNRTVWTLADVAALLADQRGGEASAIEEKNRLFAFC